MSTTQRSSRYSSAGNSAGYEDDFELEADEDGLDAGLELDAGAVEPFGEPTPASHHSSGYGGAAGSHDGAPGGDSSYRNDYDDAELSHGEDEGSTAGPSVGVGMVEHVGSRHSVASGSASPGRPTHDPYGDSDTPEHGTPDLGPRTSALSVGAGSGYQAASPPASAEPPRTSTSTYLTGGSPPSPPPPALPPLNPAVSPYLARGTPAATPGIPPAARPPLPSGRSSSGGGAGGGGGPSASHPQYLPLPAPHPAPSQSEGGIPALSAALLQQAGSRDAAAHQAQLAASIRQSVDALRASETVRQLQAAVEGLTAQVVSAERARSSAEAALVELSGRMQEQERRLNESWEARLLEKQREVQSLRTRVQQLEAASAKGRLTGSSNPRGSTGGAGASPSISPEEAEGLRKELLQTELLIRGYQQENEAATRTIKELEASLAAAEARSAEDVLRTERAAMMQREDAGRRNADTAAKLGRVLALERELQGVRDEAQSREKELKAQLDKLRAEKRALEARAGGVDLQAMADGDVLVTKLRGEMEAQRAQQQALIAEMQSKLSWYAENQGLLSANAGLLQQQREAIQGLQARLAQYEGPNAKGPAATRAATAQARVRELEAQVEQLQKALRGRAPGNSLAAVVAAARPSPEEAALVGELRERVEALEAELRVKDEDFELQLRSYQQRLEALRQQYAERAGRLEAATKNRGRAKELERQLEEQKAIFGRRVRELEAKLRAAQEAGAHIPPTPAPAPHAPPLGAGSGGPPSAAQTPTKAGAGAGQGGHLQQNPAHRRDDLVPAAQLRAREQEVRKLQTELERKSKQVSELHLKLGEAEARVTKLSADLRRSHASAPHHAPPRGRHDHLPVDERPVGPGAGPRGPQPDPYPAGGGPHDASSDGSALGLGGSRHGPGSASAEMLERLEERCGNLTVENSGLRQQAVALGREVAALREQLDEARATVAATIAASRSPPPPPPPASDPSELAALRRQLEASALALAAVQRSATEAVERAAHERAEHQRDMLRMHDEVAYREGLKWQERLATLDQELRSAQQRCEALEAELAVARSRGAGGGGGGGWSPEASAFAAMERRLDEMAREMAVRESRWRAVLADTQSLHGVQADVERRRWESTLAAKEAEVSATRSELQSLLREVAAVQELQARAAQQQQRERERD
ncbi:hypothetical protein HYH03_018235 [Edaphochlamys debaryana]|uniref:Centrosomal protein of 162 kDa n=1 Tax=Edaphochlamys debaryana TaxID=47281 RepID=A0A836BNJ5_9CHLO|nr:hypothetical protein HYH03_018235 [Edaphochlamys debaryana]|eukprot:KAG2482892.1 hypothetical protein HYH03_018235 [Edaphochlamys debaryana]